MTDGDQLMIRIQSGDQHVFEELVDNFQVCSWSSFSVTCVILNCWKT